MHSKAGQLIRAAQDVDFACETRMGVDWEALRADEFSVLKHLRHERGRREKELRDREQAAQRNK